MPKAHGCPKDFRGPQLPSGKQLPANIQNSLFLSSEGLSSLDPQSGVQLEGAGAWVILTLFSATPIWPGPPDSAAEFVSMTKLPPA